MVAGVPLATCGIAAGTLTVTVCPLEVPARPLPVRVKV